MTVEYWVNVLTKTRTARVHIAGCGLMANGLEKSAPLVPENWHGPYRSESAAFKAARALNPGKTVRCRCCD